jgi:hypothetical protein
MESHRERAVVGIEGLERLSAKEALGLSELILVRGFVTLASAVMAVVDELRQIRKTGAG